MYVEKILQRFKMDGVNTVNTLHCEAIGCLMYLAVVTRSDISFVINCAFLEQLRERHWRLVTQIFKYLRGSASLGILYDLIDILSIGDFQWCRFCRSLLQKDSSARRYPCIMEEQFP